MEIVLDLQIAEELSVHEHGPNLDHLEQLDLDILVVIVGGLLPDDGEQEGELLLEELDEVPLHVLDDGVDVVNQRDFQPLVLNYASVLIIYLRRFKRTPSRSRRQLPARSGGCCSRRS